MTGRSEPQVTSTLDLYSRMEILAQDEGIETYLRWALHDDAQPWANPALALRVQGDDTLLSEAVKSCVQDADGRYAKSLHY